MLRVSLIVLAIFPPPMLSGCAAIGHPADKPVSKFDAGDAGLNTAHLTRRLGFQPRGHQTYEEASERFNAPMNFRISPSETVAPKLRGVMPRASHANPGMLAGVQNEQGVQVYRPFSAQKLEPSYKKPAQFDSGPVQPLASPPASNDKDVSYVKMGGGSNIADWQACETLAGGFTVTNLESFSVEADFDRCMRARGYKTEQESQAELKVGWRP